MIGLITVGVGEQRHLGLEVFVEPGVGPLICWVRCSSAVQRSRHGWSQVWLPISRPACSQRRTWSRVRTPRIGSGAAVLLDLGTVATTSRRWASGRVLRWVTSLRSDQVWPSKSAPGSDRPASGDDLPPGRPLARSARPGQTNIVARMPAWSSASAMPWATTDRSPSSKVIHTARRGSGGPPSRDAATIAASTGWYRWAMWSRCSADRRRVGHAVVGEDAQARPKSPPGGYDRRRPQQASGEHRRTGAERWAHVGVPEPATAVNRSRHASTVVAIEYPAAQRRRLASPRAARSLSTVSMAAA